MNPRRILLIALILALGLGSGIRISEATSLARAQGSSAWWSRVDLIDASLRDARWTDARQSARQLADEILHKAWNDPELDSVLAELAFYQAVANANLDLRDQAIWDWYTALNLDKWIAARDLSPYGKAAKLFMEFPLRRIGEMPTRFEQRDPALYQSASSPLPPRVSVPNLFNDDGATQRGSTDLKIELIVDRSGDLHQPIVISRHLPPVVVYAGLDWLRDLPKFEPAELDGRPIDTLYPLTIDFVVNPRLESMVSVVPNQSR
jgi:hypothetical protein